MANTIVYRCILFEDTLSNLNLNYFYFYLISKIIIYTFIQYMRIESAYQSLINLFEFQYSRSIRTDS